MRADSVGTILRSARRFFSGTLLSRVTGLARDMSMAFAFGGHPLIASFLVAFRFSHLCRRLFGEGAMQAAFIPRFEACRQEGGEQRAYAFFRDLVSALVLFLLILIVIGGGVLWSSAPLLTEQGGLILRLTAALLPGLLFICVYGLNSALLQCQGVYFVPSVAPAIFNLCWVGLALWLRGIPLEQGVWLLAVGVVGATALQWAATLPPLLNRLRAYPLGWPAPFSPDVKKMIFPLLLGIAGVSATQVNTALDALFALKADPSGPAYLWYAIRLQQLPLALFGVALSGALLPPLSRASEEGRLGEFRSFLGFALKRSGCWMGFFTLILAAGGRHFIALLYQRGDFGDEAALQTLWCLWGYAVGLLPSVWVMVLAPGFYALKDYRTPSLFATVGVGMNIGLNAIMVYGLGWGPASVALATSLAAWVNAGLLGVTLWNREIKKTAPTQRKGWAGALLRAGD